MPTISLDAIPPVLLVALALGAYLIPNLLYAVTSRGIRFTVGLPGNRHRNGRSLSPRLIPAYARRSEPLR